MRSSRPRRWAPPTFALVLAAATGVASAARAQAAPDCPTASEQGQQLRDRNKYAQAREMFRACARDSCPTVVRRDCSKWLTELEDTQPTVVLSARDANGNDVDAVRVLVDGAVVAARLEGRPVAVDPGAHVFRFEMEGVPPVDERLIMQVGEKNRLLKVQFKPASGAQTVATSPATTPQTGAGTSSAGTDRPPSASPPVVAYVLGGVGLVALGSFAFFGLSGKSALSDLRSTCAPYCAQSDLDAAKTKLTIADVSLAVGVVSLGAAAVLLLTRSSAAPARAGSIPATVDVHPTAGGGTVAVRGAF